jgi:histidinol-phosphate aminotransferase
MGYFRNNIERMKGYVPGFQPTGGDFIKLNTNENPYPPSPKVIEAIKGAASESLRLYPDPMANRFREAIAEAYGVREEEVLGGNAADDLLSIIARSFLGPGDRAVYPYPTYFLYETLCKIQDAEAVEIDFAEDYSLPPEIFEAEGKVLFLCNPNSPSGTAIPSDEVKRLAESFQGIVVVDEAYVDFADENCLGLARECDNVIVLRTLSKSFSLAGMRCGFAVANENLIMGLGKVKDSFNMDRVSIAAGAAAIADIGYARRNAEEIKRTRSRLRAGLEELGFAVYPSQANFVLARIAEPRAEKIHEYLSERHIFVRYFDKRCLRDCLRITVGTDEEIDRLLEELAGMLKG